MISKLEKEQTMTQVNARSCGVYIHRGFDGRLGLDFSAGGFSVGANHMSTKSATKSIECDASARLFNHSRGLRLEFSHGDDFSG